MYKDLIKANILTQIHDYMVEKEPKNSQNTKKKQNFGNYMWRGGKKIELQKSNS
jgi:hypothetical protein